MRKNVILSIIVMLAFLLPQMTQAQKANFAGTWTFNAEKSTQPAGGGGGGGGGGRGGFGGGGNFVATQDANTLTVTRTRTGQDGTPTTNVTKYTLDGKETVNTMGQGESKSTATYSADGKTLTIVTKMNFNGNERVTTQIWSLTAPKTLSIVNVRPGRDGGAETRTTQIYEQK